MPTVPTVPDLARLQGIKLTDTRKTVVQACEIVAETEKIMLNEDCSLVK